MSLARLCSSETIEVMEYHNEPGVAMGKSTTWRVSRRLKCRVMPTSSNTVTSGAVNVNNQEITHEIYFASDPQLVQGNKLRWRGVLLTVEGMPLNSHGLGRLWTVQAIAHKTDNLNPNIEIQ
jgi:hypothetical protein